jgi:MGT family glycosyltransferase
MTTVAIVTWPYFGHIYPTLSLGASLLSRGFRVVWICHIQSIAYMLPEGGEFILIDNDELSEAEIQAGKPYGMQSLKDLYENTLVPKNEIMYRQLESICHNQKFDFIVTDQQAFSGALFAHQHNIPYATSVTAPAAIDPSPEFPEVHEYEKDQVVKFQQSMGCNIPEALVWSSPVTLVYTTEIFLQKFDFPSSHHFIGPSISKRKEWDIDISAIENQKGHRPIVLVSMGSVLPREPGFIDKVVAAFESLDIAVVVVTDPALRASWPENFFVYHYIPQLRVLQFVDAVICHAGHNTVCEALSVGIPLVTIPVAYDQSYVATKVTNSGAGLRLKYRRLSSEGLRSALMKILAEPGYKIAAQKIQQSFMDAGGEKYAAELITAQLVTAQLARSQLNLLSSPAVAEVQ